MNNIRVVGLLVFIVCAVLFFLFGWLVAPQWLIDLVAVSWAIMLSGVAVFVILFLWTLLLRAWDSRVAKRLDSQLIRPDENGDFGYLNVGQGIFVNLNLAGPVVNTRNPGELSPQLLVAAVLSRLASGRPGSFPKEIANLFPVTNPVQIEEQTHQLPPYAMGGDDSEIIDAFLSQE